MWESVLGSASPGKEVSTGEPGCCLLFTDAHLPYLGLCSSVALLAPSPPVWSVGVKAKAVTHFTD